jgi:hypothetical protein
VSNGWKSFLTGWSALLALAFPAASADVPPKIDYNKKSALENKQFDAKEFSSKSFQFKEYDAKQFSTKAAPSKEFGAKASKLREKEYAGKDYTPPTAEQIARWRKMYEAWREQEAKTYSTTNVAVKTDMKLQEQMQKFDTSKSVESTVIKPTPENMNKPVGSGAGKSK